MNAAQTTRRNNHLDTIILGVLAQYRMRIPVSCFVAKIHQRGLLSVDACEVIVRCDALAAAGRCCRIQVTPTAAICFQAV